MANELTYIGEVSDSGILKLQNRKGFDLDIKTFFPGKKVRITVKQYRKSRSNKQSNYYWGCVINAVIDGMVDAGYPRYELSPELIHEMLKAKFLKHEIASESTGDTLDIIKSTADLDILEFAEYIDAIIHWSFTFLNITIPLPNTQSEFNY